MPKTKRPTIPAPGSAIAPSAIDLTKYYALKKVPDQVLKGNAQAAFLDVESPAFGRSNAGAAGMAQQAAEDRKLPSIQFPAFQLKFSDESKTILAIPVKEFDPNQEDLYEVHWDGKARAFRLDLAYGLIPMGWGTPDKMIRRMKVTLLRNLPDVGSALLFHLKGSKLRKVREGGNKSSDTPAQQAVAAPQAAPAVPEAK